MKLHEIFNRNDQLKQGFTVGFEFAVEKYKDDFDEDKIAKARAALIDKFDVNRNKMQITDILQSLGVGKEGTATAREIAQTILTRAQKADVEISKAQ